MLAQSRLKELLHYDPSTGLFTWRVSRGGRTAGSAAGTLRSRGYMQIKLDQKTYLSHRLAFLYIDGEFPPDGVDHINQVKTDNRFINIRHATHLENQRNCSRRVNNISGFTGVFWSEKARKWRAQSTLIKKRNHLGYFDCFIDAVAARIRFNRENDFHPNHGSEKVAE